MNIIRIMLVILLFGAASAFADLYQWQDKEGVIHMTDDIQKVPEGYREKAKVFKSIPAEKRREAETEAQQPAAAQQPIPKGAELYGDHTLEWWSEAFARKRDEIQTLQSGITAKRQFVDIFEGGRRFGQAFGPGEVSTYNRYKKELPEDEKRLLSLQDEVEELRRRATIAGVPRDVRGQ